MRIQNYQGFRLIKENLRAAESLLNKLKIPSTNKDYIVLKEMLKNNTGYMAWFTKLRFVDNASMQELTKIWEAIQNNKRVIDKFSLPVIQTKSVEHFWNTYKKADTVLKVNAMYKELLPRQREFLNPENDSDKKLLLDLYNDTDRKLWLKKLKRYWTKDSLIDSLSNHLYKKTSTNFEELKRELEESNVEIVHANKEQDIIIALVNFEQLLEFAADTNWCILRKDEFDFYNKKPTSRQWIIFLLDQTDAYSKIGTTTYISEIGKIEHEDTRLKGDSILPLNELYTILKTRGVNKSIFYSVMKDYFMNKNTNINLISMQTLLDIGISREEILSRKTGFLKSDLETMTNAEKEKYKEVIQRSEKDLEKVNSVLSKMDDKQKGYLETSKEDDFYKLLMLYNNKHLDDFLANHRILGIDVFDVWYFNDSLNKLLFNPNKYSYSDILQEIEYNQLKKIAEDKENQMVAIEYEQDKLDSIESKFSIKLKPKPIDQTLGHIIIFNCGFEDLLTTVNLVIHSASKYPEDFRISIFTAGLDYSRVVRLEESSLNKILTRLHFPSKIFNDYINEKIERLNWNNLSVKFLLDRGFSLETIAKKKELLTEDDLESIGKEGLQKYPELQNKAKSTKIQIMDTFLNRLPKVLRSRYNKLDKIDKETMSKLIYELYEAGNDVYERTMVYIDSAVNKDPQISIFDIIERIQKIISFSKKK